MLHCRSTAVGLPGRPGVAADASVPNVPVGASVPAEQITKGSPVSIARKIAHKAEAVKGGFKKAVGRATGSRRLRAEGRGDQIKGNTKQAGAKIKDAVKHSRLRIAGHPRDRRCEPIVASQPSTRPDSSGLAARAA